MCYYRAGLCAEIQGKEIHLVLLHRIGYWDRMSNLYATDNKVNVNQSNMKLKYILNAIMAPCNPVCPNIRTKPVRK